jgi:hypothetical protein
MEMLELLQNSAFATWVRESPSLIAYQLFITLHTIGLAIVVGTSAGMCLRILGVASDLPLAPMEKFYGFMWLGFWIEALSGAVLFVTEPLRFVALPVLYVKFAGVILALVLMNAIRRTVFRDRETLAAPSVPAHGKALAGGVLAAWGTAIVAGRVTSYDTSVQLQTAAAVLVTAVVLGILGMMIAPRAKALNADSARAASGARRSHA